MKVPQVVMMQHPSEHSDKSILLDALVGRKIFLEKFSRHQINLLNYWRGVLIIYNWLLYYLMNLSSLKKIHSNKLDYSLDLRFLKALKPHRTGKYAVYCIISIRIHQSSGSVLISCTVLKLYTDSEHRIIVPYYLLVLISPGDTLCPLSHESEPFLIIPSKV